MDILKEQGIGSNTLMTGGLNQDSAASYLTEGTVKYIIQVSSGAPDTVYVKGIFDSAPCDASVPADDDFHIFFVAPYNPASSTFTIYLLQATKSKPNE